MRVRSTGAGSELGLVHLLADSVFQLGFPTIGEESKVTLGHAMTGWVSESIRCRRRSDWMTCCESTSC